MLADEETTRKFFNPVTLTCCVYSLVISAVNGDGYFGLEGFQMCLEKCTECEMHGPCFSCKGTVSETICRATCKVRGFSDLDQNATWVQGFLRQQYLNDCCVKCPPYEFCSDCSLFHSKCLKCSFGKYGIYSECDKNCGNCLPDAGGKLACDLYDGDCFGECEIGYFGKRCDQTCNKYCLNPATNSTKCDQQTGYCSSGCILGRYGETCSKLCSITCLRGECNTEFGSCTAGCIPGRYGERCEHNCSNTCVKSFCNQLSGRCTNACVNGRFGDTCENVCSGTCMNNTCDQFTGHCSFGCLPGSYGDTCERKCSRTCNIYTCDKLSGHCDNGCVLGWHGDFCHIPCPASCLKRLCTNDSGICESGCVPGYHGNFCEKTCSDNCLKRSCTNHSGICDSGCVPGYHGNFCEKTCSDSCMSGVCDSQTSQCVHGCRSGFEGIFCNQTLRMNTYYVFVAGTTVGTVTAIIVCVCFCLIRKTFLKRKLQSLPESLQSQTQQPTYDDIYNEISNPSDDTFQRHTYIELDAQYSGRSSSLSFENGEYTTGDRLISPGRAKLTVTSSAITSSSIRMQSNTCEDTSRVSYEVPNTCFQSRADLNFGTKKDEKCVIYSIEKDHIVQIRQNTAENEVNRDSWQYLHPVI